MDLARYFSLRRKEIGPHGSHHSGHVKQRRCLPLVASPINEDVLEIVSHSTPDLQKMNTNSSTAHKSTLDGSDGTTTFAGNGRTSRGNVIIYKQHHEASTIELFYDLFFVANLAYFTAMHQHTDAESLINYLKLFTLMWFTWLSITLFDVRFSIDCVWNRLHKAVQFGVFTGFVFAGPVFDKYSKSGVPQSYRSFAIVLVVSRAAIAIQYAVVMWQGRMFRQTLVPLGLSTAVHALAAVGYAIMMVVFPRGSVGLEEQIAWVVIAIVEGIMIFLIAMVWRILSFKYTHLVERLQLLTLIIIGEGIIGMVKNVACITKGQTNNNTSEIGTVIAAVILLYLLWMLYFDQLSHDRFGTVRQQIWSLLHYPLHSAILLCVEGNTSLIVWNSAVQALKWVLSVELKDYSDPASGFTDTDDFLSYLNQTMYDFHGKFKSKYWNATYNWNTNFTAIENYTATYGFKSDEWNNRTGSLVQKMFDHAQVFVYEAHADSLAKLNAVTSTTSSPRVKLDGISDMFNTTVMQFYVGGGTVLLVLAIMYWFNKLHKTKYEFGEMINRVVIGFTLIVVGVAVVIADQSTNGFKFKGSNWIIPIVMLFFLSVLLLDNLLLALAQYTSRHSHHRGGSWGSDNNDTAGFISKYPSPLPSGAATPCGPQGQNTPSSSLTKFNATRAPFDTPLQGRDFAPGPSTSKIRVLSRSPAGRGDITLMNEGDMGGRSNTGDFSYENTPVSALPGSIGLDINFTMSPSVYSNNANANAKNLSRNPNKEVRLEKRATAAAALTDGAPCAGWGYGLRGPSIRSVFFTV
ncbi:hypothetical protein EJ02DRAFT_504067 [Clathrospora elynae]|uniref:Low temperature requirement A n=1 Tax=Clathrospora elynae TaxID=706981 RepID=A0A6A5SLL1_9PLEO|nr:hypothetical protein EJ02DRAFT_504067 [Clathrospora elynae]